MPSLYRQYDNEGTLLYIGCAGSLAARSSQHERQSPWFKLVRTISVEHFDNIREAKSAEQKAIAAEGPLFNVQHNIDRRGSDAVSVNGHKLGRKTAFPYTIEEAEAILREYYGPKPMAEVQAFAEMMLRQEAGTIKPHWVKMLARKYVGNAKRTPPPGWDGILLDAEGKPVHGGDDV